MGNFLGVKRTTAAATPDVRDIEAFCKQFEIPFVPPPNDNEGSLDEVNSLCDLYCQLKSKLSELKEVEETIRRLKLEYLKPGNQSEEHRCIFERTSKRVNFLVGLGISQHIIDDLKQESPTLELETFEFSTVTLKKIATLFKASRFTHNLIDARSSLHQLLLQDNPTVRNHPKPSSADSDDVPYELCDDLNLPNECIDKAHHIAMKFAQTHMGIPATGLSLLSLYTQENTCGSTGKPFYSHVNGALRSRGALSPKCLDRLSLIDDTVHQLCAREFASVYEKATKNCSDTKPVPDVTDLTRKFYRGHIDVDDRLQTIGLGVPVTFEALTSFSTELSVAEERLHQLSTGDPLEKRTILIADLVYCTSIEEISDIRREKEYVTPFLSTFVVTKIENSTSRVWGSYKIIHIRQVISPPMFRTSYRIGIYAACLAMTMDPVPRHYLRNEFRCVFGGRPKTGKSLLFNTLCNWKCRDLSVEGKGIATSIILEVFHDRNAHDGPYIIIKPEDLTDGSLGGLEDLVAGQRYPPRGVENAEELLRTYLHHKNKHARDTIQTSAQPYPVYRVYTKLPFVNGNVGHCNLILVDLPGLGEPDVRTEKCLMQYMEETDPDLFVAVSDARIEDPKTDLGQTEKKFVETVSDLFLGRSRKVVVVLTHLDALELPVGNTQATFAKDIETIRSRRWKQYLGLDDEETNVPIEVCCVSAHMKDLARRHKAKMEAEILQVSEKYKDKTQAERDRYCEYVRKKYVREVETLIQDNVDLPTLDAIEQEMKSGGEVDRMKVLENFSRWDVLEKTIVTNCLQDPQQFRLSAIEKDLQAFMITASWALQQDGTDLREMWDFMGELMGDLSKSWWKKVLAARNRWAVEVAIAWLVLRLLRPRDFRFLPGEEKSLPLNFSNVPSLSVHQLHTLWEKYKTLPAIARVMPNGPTHRWVAHVVSGRSVESYKYDTEQVYRLYEMDIKDTEAMERICRQNLCRYLQHCCTVIQESQKDEYIQHICAVAFTYKMMATQ
eukprot:PhF_6_TR3386/c0_g1_i1/m.4843